MNLDIPTFKEPKGLKQFIQKYEKALLLSEPIPFVFPKGCSTKRWLVKEIKELNKDVLQTLKNRANVYAIFTRKEGASWQVNYVGQRKSEAIRERITQHLIVKDYRTGSVLNKIKEVVSLNYEVGLTVIIVQPDSLRLFVEEAIIANNKKRLAWNIHA